MTLVVDQPDSSPGIGAAPVTQDAAPPPANPSLSAMMFGVNLLSGGPAVFRFGVSTFGTDTFEYPTATGSAVPHGVFQGIATAGMTIGTTSVTEVALVQLSATARLLVDTTGILTGAGNIVFAASGTATTTGGTVSSNGRGAINFGGTGIVTYSGGDPAVGFIPVD